MKSCSKAVRVHRYVSAVVLGCALISPLARPAQASIVSETSQAMLLYPNGGYGLEMTITLILETSVEGKAPHEIAEQVLFTTRGANDKQLIAIGRALATRVEALAAP